MRFANPVSATHLGFRLCLGAENDGRQPDDRPAGARHAAVVALGELLAWWKVHREQLAALDELPRDRIVRLHVQEVPALAEERRWDDPGAPGVNRSGSCAAIFARPPRAMS